MRNFTKGYIQTSVGLTPDEKEQIEIIATKTSRSRNEVLRKAIHEFLDRSSSLLKDKAA